MNKSKTRQRIELAALLTVSAFVGIASAHGLETSKQSKEVTQQELIQAVERLKETRSKIEKFSKECGGCKLYIVEKKEK